MQNPTPTFTRIEPSQVTKGSVHTVRITGTNLNQVTGISFGGTSGTRMSASATELAYQTPGSLTIGTYAITAQLSNNTQVQTNLNLTVV
jgi:hypothetical protein